MIRLAIFVATLALVPGLAHAQQLQDLINAPVDGSAAAWIVRTFGLLTVLSVAPGILCLLYTSPSPRDS